MSDDQRIDYEALAQDAMRGVVRTVLQRVNKHGLPGDHHFYIAFDTQAPGVDISTRLREKYAEEMTIVMQHRFWDLQVRQDYFEIKLTFDSIPERLVVPFAAVKVFFDPSVPYGMQFEESELGSQSARQALGLEAGDGPVLEPVSLIGDAPAARQTSRLDNQNDGRKAPPARKRRAGVPGTGEPGTGEPGTGEPGTGEPGTGEPGTGAVALDKSAEKAPAKTSGKPEKVASLKKPRKPAKLAPVGLTDAAEGQPDEADAAGAAAAGEDGAANVVQLDAFRKK